MQLKLTGSLLCAAFAALLLTSPANAQMSPDVFFGIGTASAPSNGQSIDTFGDGTLYGAPRMGGAFGKAGVDLMITPHFGVNGETDFRFSQGSYAGLTYRPVMYDFNGVWLPAPRRLKRVVPELEAGLGGVNTSFFYSSSACDAFVGCSSSSQYVESSNHLQVHLAAGIRFYMTNHLFIRPQVDAHWVNNFSQFGSDWVPEYGAAIGWTFHRE